MENFCRLTYTEAKQKLRNLGITLKKVDGEYIVNFLCGTPATAYYTTDLADACKTGAHMFLEALPPEQVA